MMKVSKRGQVQVFDQQQVALRQLATALELYAAGEDYFSVITLAGAAEEILGMQLRSRGEDNAMETLAAGAAEMFRYLYGEERDAKTFAKRANRARNSLKHPRPDGTVRLDPREEARDMLNRAVDNFWRLEARLTPAMEHFTREQHIS